MIDIFSESWIAVRDAANKEIASAQAELESTGLALPRTEYLRGRIAALRDILALVQAKPEITNGTGNYT